ncbi:MAG: hypothetical protein SGILL_003979 [Bacillariaceae sp.]
MLINPANPQLSGVSKFPYFPVGGPQPKEGFAINKDTHPIMGYVSQWGGMETGDGMMFAANTVDGLVHQLGGKALERACQDALVIHNHEHSHGHQRVLKEGQAVITPAVGNLLHDTPYQHIIHTVPPFHKLEHNTSVSVDDDDESSRTTEEILAASYRSALDLAAASSFVQENERIRIATPLLGCGCRGFPVDVATEVAAEALLGSSDGVDDDNSSSSSSSTTCSPMMTMTLAFGIPSGEIRQQLVDAFDRVHQRPRLQQEDECKD